MSGRRPAPRSAARVLASSASQDPDWPEPEGFRAYDPHHRTTLKFHDAIEPAPGIVLPDVGHVKAILAFGDALARETTRSEGHLLVHCHMGISRSTAAMLMLLAQARPQADEDMVMERLRGMRPQAWPNLRMIEFADDFLGRNGRFTAALGRHYARQLAARPEVAEPCAALDAGARSTWDCARRDPECASASTGAGPRLRRSP